MSAITIAPTDTSELTGQIDLIVGEVKKAILTLAKDPPTNGTVVAVTKADLTLQAIVEKQFGGDFKFKIFGHDLGTSFGLTKADTHTINIDLEPTAAEIAAFEPHGIADDLVEAMRAIRDSVAHAEANEPRFKLDEATVELNFEVDKYGTINFVVTGGRKTANTHTIKLTLGPGS
jgi:Trypsin-co-occurring domain 2